MESRTIYLDATCPECRVSCPRSARRIYANSNVWFGHKFTARSLLEAHSEAEERALWAAAVALQETVKMVEAAVEDFPPAIAERLRQQARRKEEQAELVHAILASLEPFRLD